MPHTALSVAHFKRSLRLSKNGGFGALVAMLSITAANPIASASESGDTASLVEPVESVESTHPAYPGNQATQAIQANPQNTCTDSIHSGSTPTGAEQLKDAKSKTLPLSIHIEASSSESDWAGKSHLAGPVTVDYGNQHLTASEAEYHDTNQQIDAIGEVIYQTPNLSISSTQGYWSPSGQGEFLNTHFDFPERNAHGSASRIQLKSSDLLSLSKVNFSTCPIDKMDWQIKAQQIDIDQSKHIASAHQVHLEVEGVPVLYLPLLNFPVSDQRQSGFLFPIIGQSTTTGPSIQIPYYFNLAPNYDLTVAPGYSIKRGGTLDEDFRYETQDSTGELKIDWLPYDQVAHQSRGNLRFNSTTDWNEAVRLNIQTPYVSDSHYFQDFGSGTENTSIIYLNRNISAEYLTDHWDIQGLIAQFQTIDLSVPLAERPALRLPSIEAFGHYDYPYGFTSQWHSNIDVFKRSAGTDGLRARLDPHLSASQNINGLTLKETLGYSLLGYELNQTSINSHPFVSAPFESVEAAMTLERQTESVNTEIEPHALYSYTPYREQSTLPVFDTALADLNTTELFRGARFQGADRIEDQNQLALGVTGRAIDPGTGRQWFTGTIGQILYFTQSQVQLPSTALTITNTSLPLALANALNPNRFGLKGNNPINPDSGLSGSGLSGFTPNAQTVSLNNNDTQVLPSWMGPLYQGLAPNGLSVDSLLKIATQNNALARASATDSSAGYSAESNFHSSDLVGQMDLVTAYNLNFSLGELWDPHLKQSALNEARLRYQPANDKIITLSYRYREGLLEQVEGSFAWPVSPKVSLFARDIYSLKEHTQIDTFSGFEYQACCFKVELLARHYVSSFDGSRNTSIVFQVELNGLSTVTDKVSTFLEQAIRGYSANQSTMSH